jgi:hypothetical protein
MSPSFLDMIKHSTKQEFRSQGFSDAFIEQLVRGGLRSNYGQSEIIQSFVGRYNAKSLSFTSCASPFQVLFPWRVLNQACGV